MKHPRKQHYGALITLALLSFLVLFIYLITLLQEQPFSTLHFVKSVAISIVFMSLLALVDYQMVCHINRSRWLSSHLLARIALEGVVLVVLAVLFVILGNLPFRQDSHIWHYILSYSYVEAAVAGILLNLFTVTVIEFFVQNRHNQQLQQENSIMQYR